MPTQEYQLTRFNERGRRVKKNGAINLVSELGELGVVLVWMTLYK